MTRILFLLALTVPPWLATKFAAPKWVVLLSIVPFGLLAMSMGDSDEHMFGEASESVGKYLFLLLGLGSVALGLLAWSLRGTSSILGLVWWLLPLALVLLAVGVVRVFRQ